MLRAGAIGTGIVGIAMAIAGGAGLIARPDAVVWASAPLDRAVVIIPPQVLAMDGVMDIVVEGEPWMETRTARPVDAHAWHRGESSVYVQGVSSWTEVKTLKPDLYSYDGNELTGDIWRSNTLSFGATHIFPADVPAGLTVVVASRSHTPLSKISIELSRDPGYGWAWPAISAGALLAAVSMVLFALLWLDLRPGRGGQGAAGTAAAGTGAAGTGAPGEGAPETGDVVVRKVAREKVRVPDADGGSAERGASAPDTPGREGAQASRGTSEPLPAGPPASSDRPRTRRERRAAANAEGEQ